MVGRVPLAADAETFESRSVHGVELGFGKGLCGWRRGIDGFPGPNRAEGELVGRDSKNRAVFSVLLLNHSVETASHRVKHAP